MTDTKRSRRLLPVLFLLLAAVAAGLLWQMSRRPAPAPVPALQPAEPEPRREVILYFAASDATHLVAENRELTGCDDQPACLEAVVRALIAGPGGELVPVLPRQAVLRSAFAGEDGLAVVDLSRQAVSGHPGGSMSELLTVYALADTLAVNFPHIRELRILIEGQPVETLKGHVDLSRPVGVDFSYTRAPGSGGEENR